MATGVNSLSGSPIVLHLSGFVLYFLCREGGGGGIRYKRLKQNLCASANYVHDGIYPEATVLVLVSASQTECLFRFEL